MNDLPSEDALKRADRIIKLIGEVMEEIHIIAHDPLLEDDEKVEQIVEVVDKARAKVDQ